MFIIYFLFNPKRLCWSVGTSLSCVTLVFHKITTYARKSKSSINVLPPHLNSLAQIWTYCFLILSILLCIKCCVKEPLISNSLPLQCCITIKFHCFKTIKCFQWFLHSWFNFVVHNLLVGSWFNYVPNSSVSNRFTF